MILPDSLIHGDCLEVMKDIPDKSIDLILCDLPYGCSHNHWDSVIPFEPLWEQYERIIKDHAAIILFCQGMFSHKLALSNEKLFRYNLVYEKTNACGFLNAHRMPMFSHEDIIVFYKHLPVYNPQMEKGTQIKCKFHGLSQNYGKYDGRYPYDSHGLRYPRSVIKVSNSTGRQTEYTHPTQKPLALCEYLIKTYSRGGDVVLDNCMGSGTTCLAAKNTGRHYIGIEKDEKYYNIAKERVNKND